MKTKDLFQRIDSRLESTGWHLSLDGIDIFNDDDFREVALFRAELVLRLTGHRDLIVTQIREAYQQELLSETYSIHNEDNLSNDKAEFAREIINSIQP